MHDKKKMLASRSYIVNAAMRYDTQVAAAFRAALGLKRNSGQRIGKPRARKRGKRGNNCKPYKPSKKELEQCRRQQHGVIYREQS